MSDDILEVTLTSDLEVDRVVKISNIADRTRVYVVVDDELWKVDMNGFRIVSRGGIELLASPSDKE